MLRLVFVSFIPFPLPSSNSKELVAVMPTGQVGGAALISRRKGCAYDHRAAESGGVTCSLFWVSSGIIGPPCLLPSSEAGGRNKKGRSGPRPFQVSKDSLVFGLQTLVLCRVVFKFPRSIRE